MSTHYTFVKDRSELAHALDHIWLKLDKTWDGDERPDDWDTTCEAMQLLMEELGIEYNEYGTLL